VPNLRFSTQSRRGFVEPMECLAVFQSAISARRRLGYPQKTQIEVTKITDWGTCGALQCVPASRSNAIFFAAPVTLASCLLGSLKYDLGNSLFRVQIFFGETG
jgi:hypothetical protein